MMEIDLRQPQKWVKYQDNIDAETWDFIAETQAIYPDDAVDLTIARQREIYDALCLQFHHGYPEGMEATTTEIPNPCDKGKRIAVRVYQPLGPTSGPMILYYHGGGFVVGGLESHDDVCAEIAHRTMSKLISVDYRLSPENPFPACFLDALGAFQHYSASGHPILLVGDSAGGNLAAGVCEATKSWTTKPLGQVLIYPALGGDLDSGSYLSHSNAPMLTTEDVKFYHKIRANGADLTSDPRASPFCADDVSTIPPTIIHSAEIDPVCDDGKHYVERLEAAGVRAQWYLQEGLIHGYLRARHSVTRAQKSFDSIIASIALLAQETDHGKV